MRGLTTGDARFMIMEKYLTEHESDLEYVLLTDAHDVSFRRDPFSYMISMVLLQPSTQHPAPSTQHPAPSTCNVTVVRAKCQALTVNKPNITNI